MAYAGSGRNPAFGRDNGPPPPTNRPPYGVFGGYGHDNMFPQQYGQYPHPGFLPQQQYYSAPMAGPVQPTQFSRTGQAPSGNPVIDPAMPATNMTNSTGGVGCEPGYNYFFPSEHTKIHVLCTGDTPPWQLNAATTAPFRAIHVPVNLTLADLLRGFGAQNPDPRKNKLIEVHQGGGGRWYKGMTFKGDDEADMAKTLKQVGWDGTRTGLPNGKPVVFLYVTKG